MMERDESLSENQAKKRKSSQISMFNKEVGSNEELEIGRDCIDGMTESFHHESYFHQNDVFTPAIEDIFQSNFDASYPKSILLSMDPNTDMSVPPFNVSNANQPQPQQQQQQQQPQQPGFQRTIKPMAVDNIPYQFRNFPLLDTKLLVEKICYNQYSESLRSIEENLKSVKHKLNERNLNGLSNYMHGLRDVIKQHQLEFEIVKNECMLRPEDFNSLIMLEEKLLTHLSPQLGIYEIEFEQIITNSIHNECPLVLTILHQENAGPIFKDKPIGPFILKLLRGATITDLQVSSVYPEVMDFGSNDRLKKNSKEVMNSKMNFNEEGIAKFTELKFSTGTFPNFISLKFVANVTFSIGPSIFSRKIESFQTKPYIVMTNNGSQWKEATGSWIKEEAFGDMTKISTAKFYNYLQRNYLLASKQDCASVKRPLELTDFDYLIQAKLRQEVGRTSIQQKEFLRFWDWIGPGLKKIRFQKYMSNLFQGGYLLCFSSMDNANHLLHDKPLGTFLVRFSERCDGEFVISYVHKTGVRHYLVQQDDVTDKKKTFIDFLGQSNLFQNILQVQISPTNGEKVFTLQDKHKVLDRYYKKTPKKPCPPPSIGSQYDHFLPHDM